MICDTSVGLPGSGKSTFCKHLCDERSEWKRCGTDLIKSESASQGVKMKRNKDAVFDVCPVNLDRSYHFHLFNVLSL